MMWRYVGLLLLVLTVNSSEIPTWGDTERWTQKKVHDVEVKEGRHWDWHYIPKPDFTEPVEKNEMTLFRGKNVIFKFARR